MKEFRFRIIIILAAFALCLYLLYPTYKDYENTKMIDKVLAQKREEIKKSNPNIPTAEVNNELKLVEDSIKAADPNIVQTRLKRIKLGLDLQGGMRVVLEVNTGKLLEKLAKNPDNNFRAALNTAVKESNQTDESVVDLLVKNLEARGIRLSRYFGSIRDDDNKIKSDLHTNVEDAVSRAMEIIRNRVDQYGVSEPSIQRQGARRIIVELPGIAREEEAKQLLQGTALLEFKLVKDPQFTFSIMKKIDEVLAGKTDSLQSDSTLEANKTKKGKTAGKESTDTSLASADTTQKQLTEEEFAKQHPFFSIARLIDQTGQSADAAVLDNDRSRLESYLNRPDVKNVIPNNVQFVFSAKPLGYESGQAYYRLYCVQKEPLLTGGVITDATATIDQQTSAPIVEMTMNSEGATEWARITGANIHKRIAIILDGVVYSAPEVINKIPSGRSQITGSGSMEEAKLLAIVLKAGALPAPVETIEERTIGPSLGQDSINAGMSSAIIGYLLVGIFMIIYYRKAGIVAAAALVLVILFILGVLAGFSATLTLPGIAGIVLTMGMAVDANVLIYERIREEIATGKTIKASVDSGFSKAYSAIIDSNITTFFTGIILYQFGSGPVQGFALTLMIGIVTSLFGALLVARLIFDIMVAKGIKITVG
jgi:SecD/SecF fusion protein